MSITRILLTLFVTTISASALWTHADGAPKRQVPDNIGGGLRELVEAQQASPVRASVSRAALLAPTVLRDEQDRVLVNVWLDGKRTLPAVRQALAGRGVHLHAELASYGKGVIAAYVPVERAVEIAGLPGVRSVILEHKPELRLGKATTQGLTTIHADEVNKAGFFGTGVTIGALSDSFNDAANATYPNGKPDHEKQDIATGDLPGPGNPNGNTTPVVVVDEDHSPSTDTDEGRAILQIIYDIAPKSKLCFATAFTGEVQFAINILKLADPNGPCKANVIDDDVGYSEEPFFSDGVVALAADQVAADGVAYFSSAGNDNTGNYAADFRPISDATVRSQDSGPLILGNVDQSLTGGGWHNFGTPTNVQIALPILATAGTNHFLVLQWDDPFLGNIPTASYDFLVFDSDGAYRPDLSGIDNIYSTGQPVQGIILPGGNSGTSYYVAIALRLGGAAVHAQHLRILDFDNGAPVTYQEFAQPRAPSVYGHPAAIGAIAVAADYWGNTQGPEYFSSLGPTAIWLNHDNIPLAKPEIRLKPDIAAPDGVDNTFLGGPGYPNDPNPLFFGTSAAAPHAAAAAALLIEAAGGPGKLTPAQIKNLFQTTTQTPHQLKAGIVSTKLTSGADTLTVTVSGFTFANPNAFHFVFKGTSGDSVTGIKLDATTDDISFGDKTDQFLIGDTNVPTADIDYLNKNGLSHVATLKFANAGFATGHFVNLGFDFDNTQLQFGGIDASLLYGTKVTATLDIGGNAVTVSGTLSGPTGYGYSIADGYGLIDAFAAYNKLK
jgi:hypothetical protein